MSAQAYAHLQKNQQAYLTQQILTATPEQILILLYDGAIQAIKQAKLALQKQPQDIMASHNNLKRAQNIIMEFMNTLDFEIGGDVATRLYALYEYLYMRLVHANIKKDIDALNEVLAHMQQLKETWQEAMKIAARERLQEARFEEPQAISA
ncbi:MAG: flagellar export chaperone FliS [Vampirovibrionales bacterium]|nr:flagellar export chaperone FliS [Vampirovibrionales bacterium]